MIMLDLDLLLCFVVLFRVDACYWFRWLGMCGFLCGVSGVDVFRL